MVTPENTSDQAPALDKALKIGHSRNDDLLDRWGFAQQAARALRHVSPESGFVISIEGSWGSGKTSALAMIQDAFAELDQGAPVFVHFNPWIVGDKEALLRQFLSTLAKQLKVANIGGKFKEIGTVIDKYSVLFDVVKHVPGMEIPASIAKAGASQAAKYFNGLAKDKDIEGAKAYVGELLKKFPKRIIVFVDDIDRLYPSEAFEIIRIIKAVGDLPNVGYVVAMDATYVSAALKQLGVPHARSYLDKVIQTRLQIPVLSPAAKSRLINRGFDSLPEEAREIYFPRTDSLLPMLYAYGLKDILEQPRDFARLFNVVETIEPALREEVVLADIIAWAALVTKAAPVADLFRRSPEAAIGKLPDNIYTSERSEEIAARFEEERQRAYKKCSSPRAAQQIVEFLFPITATEKKRIHIQSASWQDGRMAHPSRLMIALQLAVTSDDTSFRQIQRFIRNADERPAIAEKLTLANCLDFVASVGEAAKLSPLKPEEIIALCGDIARTVDYPVFADRQRQREVFMLSPSGVALRAIEKAARDIPESAARDIAKSITIDDRALSFAATVVAYEKPNDGTSNSSRVVLDATDGVAIATFGDNVLAAAKAGTLFNKSEPREILKAIALKAPIHGLAIFSAMKIEQPSLCNFITTVMQGSFDSTKGQIFSRPKQEAQITAFQPLDELIVHAKAQIADPATQNPERAAWTALIDDRSIYARDGTDAKQF